jgi:hypothetical protein
MKEGKVLEWSHPEIINMIYQLYRGGWELITLHPPMLDNNTHNSTHTHYAINFRPLHINYELLLYIIIITILVTLGITRPSE